MEELELKGSVFVLQICQTPDPPGFSAEDPDRLMICAPLITMFPLDEVLIVTPLEMVKIPPALINTSPATLNELPIVIPEEPLDF